MIAAIASSVVMNCVRATTKFCDVITFLMVNANTANGKNVTKLTEDVTGSDLGNAAIIVIVNFAAMGNQFTRIERRKFRSQLRTARFTSSLNSVRNATRNSVIRDLICSAVHSVRFMNSEHATFPICSVDV